MSNIRLLPLKPKQKHRPKKLFEFKLNSFGVPDLEKQSNGGPVPDKIKYYGTYLYENERGLFNQLFDEYGSKII